MTDDDTDINTKNKSKQQQQQHRSIGNNTGILWISGTKDILSLDVISSNLQCQYSGSTKI